MRGPLSCLGRWLLRQCRVVVPSKTGSSPCSRRCSSPPSSRGAQHELRVKLEGGASLCYMLHSAEEK